MRHNYAHPLTRKPARAKTVVAKIADLTRPLTEAEGRARDLKWHSPNRECITVEGDAMAPIYSKGIVLLLRRLGASEAPAIGEVYLFRSRPKEMRDGSMYVENFKQLRRITDDGQLVLCDLNRKAPRAKGVKTTVTIRAAEVFYIGKPLAYRAWKMIA
jgi:hypothetical protein